MKNLKSILAAVVLVTVSLFSTSCSSDYDSETGLHEDLTLLHRDKDIIFNGILDITGGLEREMQAGEDVYTPYHKVGYMYTNWYDKVNKKAIRVYLYNIKGQDVYKYVTGIVTNGTIVEHRILTFKGKENKQKVIEYLRQFETSL
jgi:hypothetical protein